MNKLLVLDFDHTLFNTTKYVEVLRDAFLEKFNISHDEFMKRRQEVKDCNQVIDMKYFVAHLPHEDKEGMARLHHEVIVQHAAEFIFSDVNDFLMRHSKTFDILITTNGDDELQREKISHSGLPAVFDVLISKGSKADLVEPYVSRYDEVHFIDDRAKHIDEVKQAFPSVIGYFLQRPEDHPYADEPSECECADRVIVDLKFSLS